MAELYGYNTPNGFMGYVPKLKRWILFASYRDYVDYMEED